MILNDDKQARERAAAVVRAGGLVAFRTDTFYGLGADPFNRDALQSLLALKGREDGKPILVVIGDASEVARFNARGGKLFDAISARHWPGALTLVVKARPELPEELTAGTGTIGVRLPADEAVCEFVRACGGALTATSANRAGEPPARTAGEVARAFPDGLALVVDGGAARSQEPSTVLDVSGSEARLIREGAVSWRELQETIRGVR
ncbi:MAG: L-threonylcarbamoyladenylate synthase [Pyrinomonadaceae bacterium]|jgi:L-threonylcarbamoyladenylate synthase|nr:L-threonylcarbamoyladenylate synthase [Pyrinomonadaceae bacterium]